MWVFVDTSKCYRHFLANTDWLLIGPLGTEYSEFKPNCNHFHLREGVRKCVHAIKSESQHWLNHFMLCTAKLIEAEWRIHASERHTVYPKKYAHGFVVLCFAVVMQSFIMNSHEVFIHIYQGCFAGTGAIVRLPQCQ